MKKVKLLITLIFCVIISITQLYATQHNISICDSSKLEISVKPEGIAPFTYQWYRGTTLITDTDGKDSIYTDLQAVASTDEGKYYCIITDANSCSKSSDTIVVTIKSQPRIVQSDFYLCEDMNDTLTLYNSYTGGTWSVAGSPSSTITSAGIIHTNGSDDKVKFYYTDTHSGACTCKDSVTVTVINKPTVTITNNNISICEGGDTNIIASGTSDPGTTVSYQWYTTNSTWNTNLSTLNTNATQNSGTLNIAGTTADSTFYYLVEVANTSTNGGCPKDTARAKVLVYVTPTVSISTDFTKICEGGDFNLSATPSVTPVTYQWYTTNASGSTEENTLGTSSTQSYTTNVAGTSDSTVYFKLLVKHQGCPAVTSNILTDTVLARPELAAIPKDTICSGDNCTYTFSGNIPASTTYSWVIGTDNSNISGQASGSGSSFETAALYNSSTLSLNSLIYTITATAPNGCTASSTSNHTVTVRPSIKSKIYVNGVEQ